MRDDPDTSMLLDGARANLADVILPNLPPHARPSGFMVLRAITVALARLETGSRELRQEHARLCDLLDCKDAGEASDAGTNYELNRKLVATIRAGNYDAPGRGRETLTAHLMATLRANLVETNPKFLEEIVEP